MSLVVVQTTLPDTKARPFRLTEVLDRVAETAEEALEVAAIHIGGEREMVEDYLSVRWHTLGEYWLVAYEPVNEVFAQERIVLM